MHFARIVAAAVLALGLMGARASAQPAFEAYRVWLGTDEAKSLRATLIRGDDIGEAERFAQLLRDREITPTIIKRSDLPKADLTAADIVIVMRDTQDGDWRNPWGTDEEGRALADAARPMLGVGYGGLCSFGRLGLPIRGGKTMVNNAGSLAVGQPSHGAFKAPHHIAPDSDNLVPIYNLNVQSQPAHRGSYTPEIIPLGNDPTGKRDYGSVVFQRPRTMYWGFDGPVSAMTAQGKNLLENLIRWTVWASAQKDSAFLTEGTVARLSPTRQGDYTINLLLMRADGVAAANQEFLLEVNDPVVAKGWTEFARGRTDASGRATMGDLTGGPEGESYRVTVEGAAIPAVNFSMTSGAKHRSLEGRIPPRVGEHAPDIELKDVVSGKRVKLSAFKGKVVLIDFWATWCLPCQAPMQHNADLMHKNKQAWEGKAVILGVSTDSDEDRLKKHVAAKGWTHMPHLWAGGREKLELRSSAQFLFGFSVIPTACLIDQEGKIRWRGHPEGVDLEGEINKLLAGRAEP